VGALREQGFVDHLMAQGLAVVVIDEIGLDAPTATRTRVARASGADARGVRSEPLGSAGPMS
jgi:spore maturation protein SpmB